MARTIRLFFKMFNAQLKAVLEYQSDFFVQLGGAVLLNAVGFIFLWTIFKPGGVPDVKGWTLWEIVVMYALVIIAEGIGSLFFQGTWNLASLVNRGNLDFLLVRPLSPVAQVMTSAQAGMNGVGNILLGVVLIAKAVGNLDVEWTAGRIGLAFVMLISAVVIKVSLNLATNAVAFWLNSPNNAFPYSMHILGDMCRYPITIYAIGLQVTVSLVIPFAFISFFPAAAVFEKDDWMWIGLATPLVAVYCALLAATVFKRGLARYESAGN